VNDIPWRYIVVLCWVHSAGNLSFVYTIVSDYLHGDGGILDNIDNDSRGSRDILEHLLASIVVSSLLQPDDDYATDDKDLLDKRGRSYIGRRAVVLPTSNTALDNVAGRQSEQRSRGERVYIGKRTLSA